ncbi:MAG: c-type cytochrome biogenesis protein CcsB [Planctomycetota bacterium]|jgi:cytochrome c-type biogenesis protein CcsB
MRSSFYIGIAMVVYIAASVGYMVYALARRRFVHVAAWFVGGAAFATHTAAVTYRILESGRLPLTNTYETLLLFSWILALLTFWLQTRYELKTLGAFTFPLVFVALAAASLPQISSKIEPLLPSLKSNWLLAHVLTCFVAYAAFAVAFATSLIYLLSAAFIEPERRAQTLDRLDNLTYRAITLGFPLLTMGIVTGAVWANACWGRYWSWDPKETWSLITWMIYSACLHLRYAAGWKGRWAAWIAIVGFVSVIFTYLGVNYLFTSLHDYA